MQLQGPGMLRTKLFQLLAVTSCWLTLILLKTVVFLQLSDLMNILAVLSPLFPCATLCDGCATAARHWCAVLHAQAGRIRFACTLLIKGTPSLVMTSTACW